MDFIFCGNAQLICSFVFAMQKARFLMTQLILSREGMNCSVLDMKVLEGNIEGLIKQGGKFLTSWCITKFHQVYLNIIYKILSHAHASK